MKSAMFSGLVAGSVAYKAAYVEHIAVSPCGQGSCGKEQNAASVSAYADYAATAAKQGAQIIVFPEYGITGFSSYSKQSWHSGGYTESFPAPSGTVPCDDAQAFRNAPSVVSLSCAAKQHGIAIVANLMEWTTAGKMYNTNVALDTDGTYLAKYHKRNLWGESNVDTPPTAEKVSFTTSFGATFGMLVCADLIYEHPVLDLVRAGVGDFVMPLAWSNEMAQMQALAYAQGWSAANGVNLILANHRSSSESGSGILVAGVPASQTYAPSSRAGSVKVADVSTSARVSLAAPLSRFNLTTLSSKGWKYSQLTSGSQTCSGSTCCTATVTSGSTDGYVLAVLDGTDTNDGMVWPAQVCAVLPCRGSGGSSCLNFQQPTGSLTGVEVQMSGLRDGLCVPEVLATSGRNGEALLTPGASSNGFDFSQKDSESSVTVTSDAALLSAILYSRPFGNDALATLV